MTTSETTETVWVKTTSHRSRDRLRAACTRAGVPQPVPTRKPFAAGEYWQVPAYVNLERIPGLIVMKDKPVDCGPFYSGAIRSVRDTINGDPDGGSMRNLVTKDGKRIGGSFTIDRGKTWESWGIAGGRKGFATRKEAEVEQIAVWNAGPTTISLVQNWLGKARRTLASAIEGGNETLIADRRAHLTACEARRDILLGSTFG